MAGVFDLELQDEVDQTEDLSDEEIFEADHDSERQQVCVFVLETRLGPTVLPLTDLQAH